MSTVLIELPGGEGVVRRGDGEIVIAQDEADVVEAVRRDHPNPVTLESKAGRPLHINWGHVTFIEETLAAPPSGE